MAGAGSCTLSTAAALACILDLTSSASIFRAAGIACDVEAASSREFVTRDDDVEAAAGWLELPLAFPFEDRFDLLARGRNTRPLSLVPLMSLLSDVELGESQRTCLIASAKEHCRPDGPHGRKSEQQKQHAQLWNSVSSFTNLVFKNWNKALNENEAEGSPKLQSSLRATNIMIQNIQTLHILYLLTQVKLFLAFGLPVFFRSTTLGSLRNMSAGRRIKVSLIPGKTALR